MFSKTHDIGCGWQATFTTSEHEQTLTLENPKTGERIVLDQDEAKRLRDIFNATPALKQ